MNIRDYRKLFISRLIPHYDAMEAENFFYMLLENDRQLRRVDLAMSPEITLTASELDRANKVLDQLITGVPIQYLLGKAHFCGLELNVGPSVLIPRPETEELVEWIVNDNIGRPNLKIIDIGTGSGCIAIALASKLSDSKVSAIDISPKALQLAVQNAGQNNVTVIFAERDILQANSLENEFDVIVSNPPYVRELEKLEIRNNVLDHEPHLALFVEDLDPLLFYRKIAIRAKDSLAAGGKLYFEINQYLGSDTVSLLAEIGFQHIELRKDIYGNDRMIRATL